MGALETIAGRRVYIDTNVFIYALEGVPEWREPAKRILHAVDTGTCEAVTSELTLCECLVKPFELGRDDIAEAYFGALQTRRCLSLVPVGRDILIQAAHLRAAGLSLPDAIHAATALRHGCTHILTNDEGYRVVTGIEVVMLSDVRRV